MKVKEIPFSLARTLVLQSKSIRGLQQPNIEMIPVIVSMTSIPSRLHKVALVVRSILTQSTQPEHIILWLNEGMRDQIPDALQKLTFARFSIRFTPLTCSHKKLIHTLEAFKDHVIVTCDDDFMYHPNWLSALYQEHLEHPNTVIAHHIRSIQRDDHGQLKPYKQWRFNQNAAQEPDALLAIGGKGVLYPKKPFAAVYNDAVLFLKLAPKADDLWFKAMELLSGTPVRKCSRFVPEPLPITGTQTFSLKKENVDQDRNVRQWAALAQHFDLKV